MFRLLTIGVAAAIMSFFLAVGIAFGNFHTDEEGLIQQEDNNEEQQPQGAPDTGFGGTS